MSEQAPAPKHGPPLKEGDLIAHCRVIRHLASGGQGSVFLARHEGLDKDVALKILAPEFANDQEFVARFGREARAAAKLDHPNIVQVFDTGSENGLHYIVMQYVDGRNLESILDKRGRATVSDALSIAKRVALAIGAAHRLGIIHRDIKPSNILIHKQGKVLVTDFGLAREMNASTLTGSLTQRGWVVGTPDYLSPEQAMGEKADARSDVYALGATLYRMLAGQPPYPDTDPMNVILKHTRENERPESIRRLNLEVSEALESVVSRMMAKFPSGRPQTMEEVVAAIDALKGVRATPAPGAVAPAAPHTNPGSRERKMLGLGIAIGAGTVLLAVVLFALTRPSREALELSAAAVAEQSAGDNPGPLHVAIEMYSRIEKSHPGTPEAGQARERRLALEERRAQLDLAAKLAEVEASYPKRSFALCAGMIREIQERHPAARSRADALLERLSKLEIGSRARRLEELAVREDLDRAMDLVDPESMRARGITGAALRRALAGPVKEVPPFRITALKVGEITVRLAERTAEVYMYPTVSFGGRVNSENVNITTWKLSPGGWHLQIAHAGD